VYLPDPSLAAQSLVVTDKLRLLRFDVYDIALHPSNDPYNAVVRELERGGAHRNVFLVDKDNNPIWRVADYELPLGNDMFVGLQLSDENPNVAIGITADGHVFQIRLADGTLKKIGWRK
jgi:hypothetical protein